MGAGENVPHRSLGIQDMAVFSSNWRKLGTTAVAVSLEE
jgi:hypothetical protein